VAQVKRDIPERVHFSRHIVTVGADHVWLQATREYLINYTMTVIVVDKLGREFVHVYALFVILDAVLVQRVECCNEELVSVLLLVTSQVFHGRPDLVEEVIGYVYWALTWVELLKEEDKLADEAVVVVWVDG